MSLSSCEALISIEHSRQKRDLNLKKEWKLFLIVFVTMIEVQKLGHQVES